MEKVGFESRVKGFDVMDGVLMMAEMSLRGWVEKSGKEND